MWWMTFTDLWEGTRCWLLWDKGRLGGGKEWKRYRWHMWMDYREERRGVCTTVPDSGSAAGLMLLLGEQSVHDRDAWPCVLGLYFLWNSLACFGAPWSLLSPVEDRPLYGDGLVINSPESGWARIHRGPMPWKGIPPFYVEPKENENSKCAGIKVRFVRSSSGGTIWAVTSGRAVWNLGEPCAGCKGVQSYLLYYLSVPLAQFYCKV